MAVPKRIPVRRIAGYRTEYAGTWLRGQFLANVLSQSRRLAIDGDREWYAYLHEFDHNGAYLESTVECPGTGEAGRQAALQLLREWLAAVPGLTYGDIAIHPFQYEHDGTLFGLVIEDGHDMDWAELYPDRLGFHDPWDGNYDT
jgi:hypothetical protein